MVRRWDRGDGSPGSAGSAPGPAPCLQWPWSPQWSSVIMGVVRCLATEIHSTIHTAAVLIQDDAVLTLSSREHGTDETLITGAGGWGE